MPATLVASTPPNHMSTITITVTIKVTSVTPPIVTITVGIIMMVTRSALMPQS